MNIKNNKNQTTTVIIDIEWTDQFGGSSIIIKPVKIDGIIINRATNATDIPLKIGDTVVVKRIKNTGIISEVLFITPQEIEKRKKEMIEEIKKEVREEIDVFGWLKGIFKKILTALFIIAIIGVIVYFSYQHFKEKTTTIEEESEDVKLQKIEQVVSEMASKYNAITNWQDIFDKKDFLEKVYTIELQNIFIHTEGRPILFDASIDDVWEDGGQYYVRFEDFQRDINFELKCNEKQAKSLLEKAGLAEMYAVVAKVEKIYKERFPDIIAKGNLDWDVYFEESFIVTGECLDFLYLEDAPLQLLWK